jgi:signal transduction histidine kinase
MRSLEKFAVTGRIARAIAHEIRNPLTNINLASDQLKTEMVQKDDNTFLFDMISRNSSRINQLLSDLLNSTKFSELNYEKISANDLLDETLQEAEDRIALNRIKIIKKYEPFIRTISVDKAKIKVAFLNLIINAIEAMEGKENRELILETKTENNRCKIFVSDNGGGMDTESVGRLFEAYFTSKPKGNGLGLTNTQNIILNHNGEISVESIKGQGTTFIIILNFS